MARERLFGFRLVDASAVLLFIFAVSMILVGLYEMYVVYQYFNTYAMIPAIETVLMVLTLTLGTYILFKTVRYRKTTIRG